MERRTHVIFGIFLFVLLWSALKFDVFVSALAAAGAMFPDLDYKKELNTRHRKLFHNVWILAFVSLSLLLVANNAVFAIAFTLGFLSHVVADALTPLGVYPIYPLQRHRAWFLVGGKAAITTGHRGEVAFQVAFASMAAFIFLASSGFV
jgi:membrane-bound metal-dependent hydrolase YbcI (DUF457 family)